MQINNKELVAKLLNACNQANKQARKGSGNFMVVNSQVASILNEINDQAEKRKLREKKMKRILYGKNIDNNSSTTF